MNILFLTQTKSLEVFHEALKLMRLKIKVDKAGFYVAGGHFFGGFRAKNPEIDGYDVLKEWEIFQKVEEEGATDPARLKLYEEKYGDPSLWSAVVADRRLILGRRAAITQDYRCSRRHEQIQTVLKVTVEEMEKLFDRVRPDLVVGFICVTTGEYIASRIAEARGIPLLNLRMARLNNYFYESATVHEPPAFLKEEYEAVRRDPAKRTRTAWLKAQNILGAIRQSDLKMYEGAPAASWNKTGRIVRKRRPLSIDSLKLPLKRLKDYWSYRCGALKGDPQYMGLLFPIWLHRVVKPLRARAIRRWFKKNGQDTRDEALASLEYAYFPLHKEPEISLLVYGSFCLNQIEVIRNVARSLPVGMKLVVKDHPAGYGYRPLSYYEKLAEIPNVVLVPSTADHRRLIRFSKMVAVISGSTGLEALMLGKPLAILASAPFQFLPRSMVRHVRDPFSLPAEIHDLLQDYSFDEEALLSYMTAVIENSVPIDFYSLILQRAEHPRDESEREQAEIRKRQLGELADYLLDRFHKRSAEKTGERARFA